MNFGIGSDSDFIRSSSSTSNRTKSSWNSTPINAPSSFLDDQDTIFSKPKDPYDDVFGGPPKYNINTTSSSSVEYDLFKDSSSTTTTNTNTKTGGGSNSPVYDKPVYDDEMDIFQGVRGVKTSSSSADYVDVLASPKKNDDYDDFLGLGKQEPESSRKRSGETEKEREREREKEREKDKEKDMSSFDDLIPGFGGSSPNKRTTSETTGSQKPTVPLTKSASSVMDEPFVVLEPMSAPIYVSAGLFTEPMEPTDKPSKSGSVNRGGLLDDMDPLSDIAKSVPKFSSDMNNRAKDGNNSKTGINMAYVQNSVGEEPTRKAFAESGESVPRKHAPVDDYRESHQTLFDMPTVSSDSHKSFNRNGSRAYADASPTETNSQGMPPKPEDNSEAADDIWLTVSEIPLFTQPTSAPPPSRPPPPRPRQASKTAKGSHSAVNTKKANEFSSPRNFYQTYRRPEPVSDSAKSSGMSPMSELEDFAMGKHGNNADEHGDSLSSEEDAETNSTAAASAAAMKEAMDRAEAKFKHAREVRERGNVKVAKNRGFQQERDEKVMQDLQERELREKQERLEREQREREEKEREQRKLEKEKERQAVERATKEARDRAAIEARQRAERAAVEKAKNDARERAERAAVQRAHAEARERAAAEAKERAERTAAEAKERANAEKAAAARAEEARRQRTAVDRVNQEARERAAAEAQQKATATSAAGRGSQQSSDNDLESFFGMGARPSSAPKSRTTSSVSTSYPQSHSRASPEGSQWSSAGSTPNMRKASSTTNIVDDLTSIFGEMKSSGDFQEQEGETEERRRARLERHQRTQDRAKQALAEKNERDLKTQREQAERHRIAETMDVEIKRWAAGKEGNVRALLSTLQYVLWEGSGWQAVSLTDLITGASVKKVYRKATLCVHPDKVQQKGATLAQKYIAEKVFDLLKEAWNKFNSEELF